MTISYLSIVPHLINYDYTKIVYYNVADIPIRVNYRIDVVESTA